MYNYLLHTMITVADAGSFAKAANTLYISQVAVMKQINSLEKSLGIKIFERTSQGVFLTKAGESIYHDAKRIIGYSDEAIRRAQKIAGIQQYTIRIGTSILRPYQDLINLWNSIEQSSSPFQFEIIPFNDDHASLKNMFDSLGQTIDCFIGPCDFKSWQNRYSIEVLGSYNCCLAVSKTHRLAKKRRLTLDELAGETIGLLKPGESTNIDQLRTNLQNNYPQIKIKDLDYFYGLEVFNACQRSNYFIESLTAWDNIHPNIATIPVDWNYKIPYGIIYSKNPSNTMQQFINEIKKVKQ